MENSYKFTKKKIFGIVLFSVIAIGLCAKYNENREFNNLEGTAIVEGKIFGFINSLQDQLATIKTEIAEGKTSLDLNSRVRTNMEILQTVSETAEFDPIVRTHAARLQSDYAKTQRVLYVHYWEEDMRKTFPGAKFYVNDPKGKTLKIVNPGIDATWLSDARNISSISEYALIGGFERLIVANAKNVELRSVAPFSQAQIKLSLISQ